MSEPRQDHLHNLSEPGLRELYDEEEVERFISLFSAYVTEIRLSTDKEAMGSHIKDGTDSATTGGTQIHSTLPRCSIGSSLPEYIAYNYLLPRLPIASNVAPPFTLKRFTLTIQRLYLVAYPVYRTFLLDLAQLALWKDYQRSLRYCTIYWFLWLHDLLLPTLIFRVVFGLLRRRLSTSYILRELQERRQETEQALRFGEAVQQRLSISAIGPIEIWRIFRSYKSGGREKTKLTVDMFETEEETLKREILFVLNGLADVLERIKNVFAWRRPDVSRRYLLFLIVIGFGTLVLPTRWIAKLTYMLGGVLFWHVTPIIAALPRPDRAPVSMLFSDAPTDADYALELIAKRIEAGQEIDVTALRNRSRHTSDASMNTDHLANFNHSTSRDVRLDGIDWKKWNERVARGKLFVEEGSRFLSTHMTRESPDINQADAHTFLAQYASHPGLITLTSSTLSFTSFAGTRARLIVPRNQLRGVRRSGLMKGISITWVSGEMLDGGEREDKFHWVGNRDELFARLVGSDGGRWTTA